MRREFVFYAYSAPEVEVGDPVPERVDVDPASGDVEEQFRAQAEARAKANLEVFGCRYLKILEREQVGTKWKVLRAWRYAPAIGLKEESADKIRL